MRGYFDQPAADAVSFDADGYFKTGDLGMLDEEGYFTFRAGSRRC